VARPISAGFNVGFDRYRNYYGWLLAGILRRRVLTPLVAGSVVAGAVVLSLFVGSDFFPQVDAGLIQLHVRARRALASNAPSRFSGRSKTISVN
jgi:multidrug efflux pump subunit AcrB